MTTLCKEHYWLNGITVSNPVWAGDNWGEAAAPIIGVMDIIEDEDAANVLRLLGGKREAGRDPGTVSPWRAL